MTKHAAYEELAGRSRERALMVSCSALLGWDEQTYMPSGGAESRGEQLALLAGLQHDRATDTRVGALLEEAEAVLADASSIEAADLREMRRDFDRAIRLPRSLVQEIARATSAGQHEWVTARANSDFKAFQPRLAEIIDLKQQEARCLGAGVGELYDALLDEYEPGARAQDLSNLFALLRLELVPLVCEIAESSHSPDSSILLRDYPVDRQRIFGEQVAKAVGFDFDRGRLDTTAHPFCSGIGPGDCRITTRFAPRNLADGLFGILHEVGHGLYDQGLDPSRHGLPTGEAVSLGIHESQSRLWENAVGRSRAFWAFWYPKLRSTFPDALRDVDPETFYRAVNHSAPSLIRVKADEVTYNLHIMARFELERALIADDLAVDDLPGAWSEAYRRDLGIVPNNDAEGCLQDIHWAAGLVGYFPTYTLGNLYAAQFFDRARQDLGNLDESLARGETAPLLDWLGKKIHRQGKRYRAVDLVERVTGSAPDHRPLVNALQQKYREIYH